MTVTDINQLVQRFEQAAKMMKTVARGGVPQVPGMGPIPGMGSHGGKKKQNKKKGKSRSGNPAKRARENAALAQGTKPVVQGSGFGIGNQGEQKAPSEDEMAKIASMLKGTGIG